MQLSETKRRIKRMEVIYSFLISNNPSHIQNRLQEIVNDFDFNEKDIAIFQKAAKCEDELVEVFTEKVTQWKYSRIGIVEKAIIFLAYLEHKYFATPKIVLIDQCVLMARKYGDEKAYKFINAVLEIIL